MLNTAQEEQLKTVTAETLGVETDEITDESSPKTLAAWTSFTHLTLMATVEEAFGIMFSMDEMTGIASYGDLRRIVGEHLA